MILSCSGCGDKARVVLSSGSHGLIIGLHYEFDVYWHPGEIMTPCCDHTSVKRVTSSAPEAIAASASGATIQLDALRIGEADVSVVTAHGEDEFYFSVEQVDRHDLLFCGTRVNGEAVLDGSTVTIESAFTGASGRQLNSGGTPLTEDSPWQVKPPWKLDPDASFKPLSTDGTDADGWVAAVPGPFSLASTVTDTRVKGTIAAVDAYVSVPEVQPLCYGTWKGQLGSVRPAELHY